MHFSCFKATDVIADVTQYGLGVTVQLVVYELSFIKMPVFNAKLSSNAI